MARLQFHDQMRVQDLSEPQLNALSALLSAPAAAPRPSTPLLPFSLSSSSSSSSASASTSSSSSTDLLARDPPPLSADPLPNLVLEEDLKRARRADIAHHRTVGTLKGRQHAMGLPVRGQRNRTNAKTAKKLNRIERRVYSTGAAVGFAGHGCVRFPRFLSLARQRRAAVPQHDAPCVKAVEFLTRLALPAALRPTAGRPSSTRSGHCTLRRVVPLSRPSSGSPSP